MTFAIKKSVVAVGLAAACVTVWSQDKVVYHIDHAEMQATKGCAMCAITSASHPPPRSWW